MVWVRVHFPPGFKANLRYFPDFGHIFQILDIFPDLGLGRASVGTQWSDSVVSGATVVVSGVSVVVSLVVFYSLHFGHFSEKPALNAGLF